MHPTYTKEGIWTRETHHSPETTLPSARSTTFLSGSPSLLPSDWLLATAALNLRAVWHMGQLEGIEAGGVAMRMRTGVRSPAGATKY